ncbi:unnamed protein product, partial [marine sediment metagenome]
MDHQKEHFERLVQILGHNFAYLDTSQTGCGKTFTTMKIGKASKLKLFVICPKSVCSVWNIECRKYGVDLVETITYEKLRGTKKQLKVCDGYINRNHNHFRASDKFTALCGKKILLVFDEVHRVKNRATATLA